MDAVMRVLHHQRSHAIAIPNITTIIMIGNQTPWEHWRIVFVYLPPLFLPSRAKQQGTLYNCVLLQELLKLLKLLRNMFSIFFFL